MRYVSLTNSVFPEKGPNFYIFAIHLIIGL